MSEVPALLVATFFCAAVFDFTNGFHDTSNAISTVVSTRALRPYQAVLMSAALNLIGALVTVVFFKAKVSNTIASTLAIHAGLTVLLAALLGAISWNLLTWYLGLPSSSTHALIGGLVGAGLAAAGGPAGVKWSALGKQVVSLVISPPIGLVVAAVLIFALIWLIHGLQGQPGPVNRTFRHLQVLSSAFVSYSHGSNDAQKTMAVMTLALIASGHLQRFQIPLWVVVLSALTIGFGTWAGGWRIIKTVGWRIYEMTPVTGVTTELTSAGLIQVATQFGLPVSTTHVVIGSVIGAGVVRKFSAVRWGVGLDIVTAWVLTIPAAAVVAWIVFAILHTAGLRY
jgi:PiT family inorganic phosphate transporter